MRENAFFLAPAVVVTAKISWELYSLTHEEEIKEGKQWVAQKLSERTGYTVETCELVMDGLMMVGSTAKTIKGLSKAAFSKIAQTLMHNPQVKSKVENLIGTKTPHSTQQTEKPVSQKRLASANNNLHRDQSVEGLDLAATKKGVLKITPQNVNAQAALQKKMSALEDAQRKSIKVKSLPDGRVRYYEKMRPAKSPGETIGSSYVTEYNTRTGQVRSWNESYNKVGNVNRVNPKMIDGKKVTSTHYPMTQKEIEFFKNK